MVNTNSGKRARLPKTATKEIQEQKKLCDMSYLAETLSGKKPLIKEIMDDFLALMPVELTMLNNAIAISDYAKIKSIAHKMRSSVSLMGIYVLEPVLIDLENTGTTAPDIEKATQLYDELDKTCKLAFKEIESEKQNYS